MCCSPLATAAARGCTECGISPLPNGFDQNRRMDNAVQVRLTDSGLDFLESNLGPLAGNLLGDGSGGALVISFEVPSSKRQSVHRHLSLAARIRRTGQLRVRG